MADFLVTIGADFSQAQQDLIKLRAEGKITEKQYAASSAALERAYKAAVKQARALAKAEADVGKQAKESFAIAKEGAEAFGGKVGGAVAMVEKMGKSIGAAGAVLGPFGAVAAAGALAVGGLAFAAVKVGPALYDAAQAAADFARENADIVDPGTLANLTEFQDTIDAVGLSASLTGATIAGQVVGDFQDLADVSLRVAVALGHAFGEGGVGRSAIEGFGEGVADNLLAPVAAVASLMEGRLVTGTDLAARAIEKLDDATADYADEAAGLVQHVQDLRDKQEQERGAKDAATKAERAARDAAREREQAIRDLVKQVEQQQSAEGKLRDIIAKATDDQVSDTERAARAQEEAEAQIVDLALASKNAELAQSALAATSARTARDIAGAYSAAADSVAEDLGRLMDQIDGSAEAWTERMASRASAIVDSMTQVLGAFADIAGVLQDTAQRKADETEAAIDSVRDRVASTEEAIAAARDAGNEAEVARLERLKAADEAQIAQLQAREKQQQALAIQNFKLAKALDTTQAIMNGAVAFTLALAVIPPPFGELAAAGIAASTAAQVAIIQSQQPPQFAMGGMVGDRISGDHHVIAADPEEGILTRRGVEAVGGREGLADLNRGRASVGATTVQVYLDGALFAEAVQRPGVAKAIAKAVRPHLGLRGF